MERGNGRSIYASPAGFEAKSAQPVPNGVADYRKARLHSASRERGVPSVGVGELVDSPKHANLPAATPKLTSIVRRFRMTPTAVPM